MFISKKNYICTLIVSVYGSENCNTYFPHTFLQIKANQSKNVKLNWKI